jgi:hypothetical protein
MLNKWRAGSVAMISVLCALAFAACASGTGAHAPPATTAQPKRPSVAAHESAVERLAAQERRFSAPTEVDNPMFPLEAGTQFVYRGTVLESGRSRPHTVVFTVTDLTKVIHGVRTVVAWDRDFLVGRLQEQELAFFAQDDAGNVWNFGEYPEEYDNGKFTGAPDTWIAGTGHAYGGIHMLAHPTRGARYREGLVPPIEFNDVSKVSRLGQMMCMRLGCFRHALVVDEWSPNDPAGGHQIKYYAPDVGLVRVGARGGDSQEYLTLSRVRHLSRSAMAAVRSQTLAMDRRAFAISRVYRVTMPVEPGG